MKKIIAVVLSIVLVLNLFVINTITYSDANEQGNLIELSLDEIQRANDLIALDPNYLSLSVTDQLLLSSYLKISKPDIIFWTEQGFLIQEICKIDTLKNNYQVSPSDLSELLSVKSLDLVTVDLALLNNAIVVLELPQETTSDMIQFLIQGNEISSIIKTALASKVFNLDIVELFAPDLEYGINIEYIMNHDNFKDLTIESVLSRLKSYESTLDFNTNNNVNNSILLQDDTIGFNNRDSIALANNSTQSVLASKENEIFYNIGPSENISSQDGNLIFIDNLFSLPGKNGLDTSLSIIYNNALSNVGQEDGQVSYVDHYDTYRKYYVIQGYRVYKRVASKNKYFREFDYIETLSFNTQYELETHLLSIVKNPIRSIKCSDGQWYQARISIINYDYSDSSFYSHTSKTESNLVNTDTYEENRNPIGIGWSWAIPSIEVSQFEKYLHFGNGSTFLIDEAYTPNKSNLKGYELNDISIMNDPGTFNSNGQTSSYVVTNKSGTKQYFSIDGSLIGTVDLFGNSLKYEYQKINNTNVLCKIIDTLDRKILISYSDSKVIITKPDGSEIILSISKFNNSDLILNQIEKSPNNILKFEYSKDDYGFNLFSKNIGNTQNKNVNLIRVIHPNGDSSEYSYAKVLQNFGSLGVRERFRIKSRVDFVQNIETKKVNYVYSENTSTGFPNYSNYEAIPSNYKFSTTLIDIIGRKTEQTFNNYGKCIKENLIDENNNLVISSSFLYDETKQLKESSRNIYNINNGQYSQEVNKYQFDIFGNLITYLDASENNQVNTYDTLNFHLLISSRLTDKNGILLSSTDNILTEDKKKIQTTILNGNSLNPDEKKITNYLYDQNNNIIKKSTSLNKQNLNVTYEYDSKFKNAYLTKESIENTQYTYDEMLNKWTLSNSLVCTGYEYDFLTGLVISKKDPNNNVTLYNHDLLGRTSSIINSNNDLTEVLFDDKNNTVKTTFPNGYVKKIQYDIYGNVISEMDFVNSIWRILSAQQYDSLGRLSIAKDANGNEIIYEYDSLNRVKKCTFPDNSSVLTEYEDELRLKRVIDQENHITETVCDVNDNVVIERIKLSEGEYATRLTTYNALNQVIQITDPLGNTNVYNYDAFGRLVSVKNAMNELTTYSYGLFDYPTKISDPLGRIVLREYNSLGLLMKEVSSSGVESISEYDNYGNTSITSDKKGQITKYEYNTLNQLVSKITEDSNATFSYDSMGNLLTSVENNNNMSYFYSIEGNLIKTAYADDSFIEYTYDLNGNKLSMKDYFGKVTQYSYDTCNRVEQITSDENIVNYSYYPNG